MLTLDTSFWLVVCGFVIAFVLAFGIGANDVANSFGTSVGSKVLTLKQACILATIFEILGSILIGAKVSGTIRKGILDPTVFEGTEIELMLGYVSALVGCCVWLILATILNYPVSGTHSIVGATVGMAIVSRGINVIKWKEIIKIVASWFLSPLLSGVVSLLLFILIRRFILRAESPLTAGLKFLPFIYTVTIFVNIGGVVESSPPLLGFNYIPWWGKILLVVVISGLVYLGVWLIVVPYMKKKIERTLANSSIDDIEQQKLANKAIDLDDLAGRAYLDEDEKKNATTQVDYVQLIMSRNEDASRYMEKAYSELEQHQKGVDSSTNTVNIDPRVEGKKPLIRMRTITAPTSASKDPLDYGDVNLVNVKFDLDSSFLDARKTEFEGRSLRRSVTTNERNSSNQSFNMSNQTLRGYLHTIHTPAMRQQLSRSQLSHRSNQARDRQSIANSMSSQNPSSGNIKSENPFARIFNQKNTAANNDDVQLQETGGNEKRGRFNLVPASVSGPATSPAVVPVEIPSSAEMGQIDPTVSNDKYDRKSMIDEEDVDQIMDLPAKPKKEPKIDLYAHSDPPAAAKLFSFLQVLTAVFGSFAHGGNDVSNAIGPLIGLYLIYQEGRISRESSTPEWILFYGGVGISVGLWVLGRRVIKTIGEDLTKITASSGFVIELASAMTVLGASLMNIPVSTTHCKVGSVVFTGRVRSKESVDWSLFRNIIIAWIVTVPVTGSIAAFCQFMLKLFFNIK